MAWLYDVCAIASRCCTACRPLLTCLAPPCLQFGLAALATMTGSKFIGKVISNRMQKSVLVAVDRLVRHTKYDRVLRRTTKLMAHDEKNECNIGDIGAWRVQLR